MDKIWLVSYPRSGSTWIRFLLANVLYPDEEVNYITINKFVPDAHQQHMWRQEGVENPLVVKSHQLFRFDYRRIIYVYRDGRDVAISLYYYAKLDEAGITFERYFSDLFFQDRIWLGYDYVGTWYEHVNMWLYEKVFNLDILPIRYEDLLASPVIELRKIISFLGRNIEPEILSVAVCKSDYKELKKIAPRDGQAPVNFGLRGTAGGWENVFNHSMAEEFWQQADEMMKKLGYGKERMGC